VSRRVVAVALTAQEIGLLVSALALLDEHEAYRNVTAPIHELLETAIDIDDLSVRAALDRFMEEAPAPRGGDPG
jgi:hypothetical protein